jgi:hypothetical protein
VLGDSLVRSAQPQMSARHANPRKSNCCDSGGCCSISIHRCQREIGRGDSSGADFWRCGSFAVARGRGLRFGFAIGRPNGIASRASECRTTTRVSMSDTKRARRIHAASVLASRAPLLAAQRAAVQPALAQPAAVQPAALHSAAVHSAAVHSATLHSATVHSSASRACINFFDAIHFRFAASGRLSTAMIDASQPLIGSNGGKSTVDVDRASDCADVSARWDVSRDDRRFNRRPLTPMHLARGHLARRVPVCGGFENQGLDRQIATRSGALSGSHPTERAA